MNNYKQLFWSNNYVLIKNAFSKYEAKFITSSANKILSKDNKKYKVHKYKKDATIEPD